MVASTRQIRLDAPPTPSRGPTPVDGSPVGAGGPVPAEPPGDPRPARAAPPRRRARAVGLDRLRGLALVAMLVHHLTDWFTGDARAVIPGWPLFAVTDLAAVAFFVAAGASATLFLDSRRAHGMPVWPRAGQVLRRYGLLIPLGMVLQWALRGDAALFGVLQAMGVAVVIGAALVAVLPDRLVPVAAGGVLVAGVASVRAAEGHDGWLASEVLRGTFPVLVYLGFTLVGMAAVRTGAHRRPGPVAVVAAAGGAATIWLLAGGTTPARYPTDVSFIVPGLAGTALAFLACQVPWPPAAAGLDRLVRRSGAHTLGIFVSHYGAYWVLDRTGTLGDMAGGPALLLASAITLGLCLAAPHVPVPPWSPRLGWRRRRGPSRPALSRAWTRPLAGGAETGGRVAAEAVAGAALAPPLGSEHGPRRRAANRARADRAGPALHP